MGILDKAKGFAESHRGQVEQGLQKAKEAVNKHAGGGVNPGTAQNPSSPPLSAEPVDEEPTDGAAGETTEAAADETTEAAADETRDTETPIMGVSQPGPGSSGSTIVPPAPPGSSGSTIVPPAPPTGPSVGAPAVAPEES